MKRDIPKDMKSMRVLRMGAVGKLDSSRLADLFAGSMGADQNTKKSYIEPDPIDQKSDMFDRTKWYVAHSRTKDRWILERQLLDKPLDKKALAVVVLYGYPKRWKSPYEDYSDHIKKLLDHIEPGEKDLNSSKGELIWFCKPTPGEQSMKVVWVY